MVKKFTGIRAVAGNKVMFVVHLDEMMRFWRSDSVWLSLLKVWLVGVRLYRLLRVRDFFCMCLISELNHFGEGDFGTLTLGTSN